jgi:hypothetical protein
MRFLVHGTITPEGQQAMLKNEQALHTVMELSEDGATEAMLDSPAELLKVLAKKQWNLFTTDGGFVDRVYEEHVEFNGVIVLLMDDPDVLDDQAPAVERLFERYKRLTPRRLYTITPSRVKIRQLPGAGQAG